MGGDGFRLVRIVTGPKSAALAVEAELLEKLRVKGVAKRRQDGQALTMDRLMAQWIEQRTPDWCARRPVEEAARWRNHASSKIGSVRAEALTAKNLDDVYRTMRGKGLSPRSVQQVHSQISAAFNLAVCWGQVSRNPTAQAVPPKPKRRKYPIQSRTSNALPSNSKQKVTISTLS